MAYGGCLYAASIFHCNSIRWLLLYSSCFALALHFLCKISSQSCIAVKLIVSSTFPRSITPRCLLLPPSSSTSVCSVRAAWPTSVPPAHQWTTLSAVASPAPPITTLVGTTTLVGHACAHCNPGRPCLCALQPWQAMPARTATLVGRACAHCNPGRPCLRALQPW